MPAAIAAVTSTLFLDSYDPRYTISMLVGLILFFYFAECVRKAAVALRSRRIHHYAIPIDALRLYAPSILITAGAWLSRTPRDVSVFFAGAIAFTASILVLWVFIWGTSRLIRRTAASHRLFLPTANYGLNLLVLFTPIFYPLSAVRIEFLRTIIGYNPLAVAIMATRAALLNDYSAISTDATVSVVIAALIIGCAGYFKRP